MTTFAIVPVQYLADVKSRLADRLPQTGREALVQWMLDRVIATLREVPEIEGVLVVTPDERVAEAVRSQGAIPVRQEGTGLNAAIRRGQEEAIRRGASAVLVTLADLPLLSVREVREIVTVAPGVSVVIGPDRRHEGTNVLFLRPPDAIAPAFGPGSLASHRGAVHAKQLTVQEYESLGVGLDVDTGDDLDELQRLTGYRSGNSVEHVTGA